MDSSLVSTSIVTLIFGGCCSNVFTLEAILKHEPDSGLIITFAQFVVVSLATLPTQLSPIPNPGPNGRSKRSSSSSSSTPALSFLKPTSVPLRMWFTSSAMFYAINMLNNWAFAFKISVPAHIILRSFGSVMTMGAGWLKGKRYSKLQMGSVLILTMGVMVSAFADAKMKGKSMDSSSASSLSEFVIGLLMLFIAQVLSAWMGVYVQDIYSKYHAHWLENLFYSHVLSLPLFVPLQGILRRQYKHLEESPPLEVSSRSSYPSSLQSFISFLPASILTSMSTIPESLLLLLVNAITQLLCISGVYLLSARSSAVTVTVVLNVRKLVSFMFSVWLFGNELSGLMILGAALVFGAGALYGWETTVGISRRKENELGWKANGGGKEKNREYNGKK